MDFMRFVGLITIAFFFATAASAQMARPTGSGSSYFFNSFQYFTTSSFDSSTTVDSAIYYLRKLSQDPRFESSLQTLLHNSFAQGFILRKEDDQQRQKELEVRRRIDNSLLRLMVSDTCQRLRQTAAPIFAWTRIQESINDQAKLKPVLDSFIQDNLNGSDLRINFIGRYALMIHQLTANAALLQSSRQKLFDIVTNALAKNQVTSLPDSAGYVLRDRRTWYRYLYAYCMHHRAVALMAANKTKEAEEYFRKSFLHSPDLIDKNNSSSYFYDMIFLFGEENDLFRDDYKNYVLRYKTDKTEARDLLLSMAAVDPGLKPELKKYYKSHFASEGRFSDYWRKSITKEWKKLPTYTLTDGKGVRFSINDTRGKWLLLDFWGTWCAPCRREHPDMEKFSKEINTIYKEKISLMTFACMDKEEAVHKYMTEKNYSFPVMLSDGKIEKALPVQGYPTKLLISPDGKYTMIPFGIGNWVEFVKQYCDL